jgi:hypothetical protein
MNPHAPLITVIAAPLDPPACDQALQNVAHRGALHAEARGETRSGNAGLFADTRQRAVHCNRCVGHALELAIERPHAVHECPRRQQSVAFEGASPGEPACTARRTFSH